MVSSRAGPCFGEALTDVLQPYYRLQAALAADDDARRRGRPPRR